MTSMTQKEIEAADIIIKNATSHGVLYTSLFHPDEENKLDRPVTNTAVKYLVENGLLEVFQHHAESFLYRLTTKGLDLQRSGKNYSDYLEEQKQKAERDNLHKDLQIQDSKFKVEKLNPAQYESYSDLWKRHWMVVAVPLVALFISFLIFMLKK